MSEFHEANDTLIHQIMDMLSEYGYQPESGYAADILKALRLALDDRSSVQELLGAPYLKENGA